MKFLAIIDWNMVAAIAASVAALAAVVTAGIIVWQTRRTLRIQTLIQLQDAWESPPIYPRMRERAARALLIHLQGKRNRATALQLSRPEGAHVDEILDFFETVAFFVKETVLDYDHAYHAFYQYMSCYWTLTESYVHSEQKLDEEIWKDYSALMGRFSKRSGRRVTIEDAKSFLEDELSRTSEK